MASDTHDIARDKFMLTGDLASCGYDWWWHSFTAHHAITGEAKPFFIEFFCINPALGGDSPIFGQLLENKRQGVRPSYVMVKAGCWGKDARQIHRFFAWNDVVVGQNVPYYVSADDCLACETDLIGRVEVSANDAKAYPEWMSDAGSMIWDLHVDKRIAYNVGPGASAPLRNAQLFEMYWHAEGIKTAYSGTVVLDGETYVVDPETSFGYSDKNWGSDFTSPWVWLSSCNLTSSRTGWQLGNCAFEIGGGRPKVGPIVLDHKLLGCIYYDGRPYEFNFSKPWTKSTTDFTCWETDDTVEWRVDQSTRDARLQTSVSCKKDEMLLAQYEAPNGTKRHTRLWNGSTGTGHLVLSKLEAGLWNVIDEIDAANIGCEYGEYDALGPYENKATARR
jgi:tocopherol cyclase